jgi:shikimate kinase
VDGQEGAVNRIALIGLRATGKTTLGRAVAARLGWAFADADDVVEAIAGQSIASIFATHGEAKFRDLEADAIAQLCGRDRIVVATGGGAVLRPETRSRLKSTCQVVWLTADIATMLDRLAADAGSPGRRPSLTGLPMRDEIERLKTQRESLYRDTAHRIVDTAGRPCDMIIDEILTPPAS